MIRSLIRYGVLAGAIGLGGCDLLIQNPNNPETERVLKTPTDVESLLGTQYLRWHSGLYNRTGNVQLMSMVQSFEDFSSLSNNCLGQRVGIPRAANDNTPGNGCGGEQLAVYSISNEVARITSNVIAKLNDATFTLGTPAQDLRARAFAEMMRGLALGYIALTYDSAAVITPQMDTQDPGAMVAHGEVMDSAFAALQAAIDAANAAAALPTTVANNFPLPGTWIPSPTVFTVAEFTKMVRSYRARLRANVARTPAERAAVNWDLVIADAQNGFSADHLNSTNTTTGPFQAWLNQLYAFTTWHQMTPFILGMADGSDGAYAAWIALPLDSRGANGAYFQTSPDLRFPQGATRAAQQTDFAISSCNTAGSTCKRYFVNRASGLDQSSGPSWGYSNYDHVRFYPWKIAGSQSGLTANNGPLVFFTKAELDMLEAEGHIRKGEFNLAAALINKTRVTNGGLPAITIFDGTSSVPGGTSCVPKTPANAVSAGGGTVSCGTMFEAMKYEKRIESAYTHFMAWYLDGRGWGDLPEGTGYDWPTPYQDLQARGYVGAQIYNTGGPGNYHAAAKGTYGW